MNTGRTEPVGLSRAGDGARSTASPTPSSRAPPAGRVEGANDILSLLLDATYEDGEP